MLVTSPSSHLSVSSVIVLKSFWFEFDRLSIAPIILVLLDGVWSDFLRFGWKNLWSLQWIFFPVLPVQIMGLLLGRDFLRLGSWVRARIRILVLCLVNDGRGSLLLFLYSSAIAKYDKHLILEPVEPVVIWLVILPLAWGHFLILRASGSRPLALANWLVVFGQISTRGYCVFWSKRAITSAIVKPRQPILLFFTYFLLLDPILILQTFLSRIFLNIIIDFVSKSW